MSENDYIFASPDDIARYNRICAIIVALEDQQILAVGKSDIQQYTLDNGQTKISTMYRSPDAIAKAITEYEKIKNRLYQKISGTGIIRLADAESVQSNGKF